MTPAQQSALVDELRVDPAVRGYSQYMPDAPGMVLQLLNEQSDSMVKAIKSSTGQAWAAAGPYANIVDAGNDPAHPCRPSCLMLRDTLVSGVDIHVESGDVQYMLAAWVATNVITQLQLDDLFSRAKQPASRVEVLNLGAVTEEDVRSAWQP